ncbi:MAG: PSD1 domain-containing protein [Planctomycetales bacterium]|nr:PSD1 domain-containing protein [Planctomycetales bacterium]
MAFIIKPDEESPHENLAMTGKYRLFRFHPLLVVAAFSLASAAVAEAEETVSFERHVLPLLDRRCNRCHHRDEPRGGLDLSRLETILRGGDELGPAAIPGKPSESPLIKVLDGTKEPAMPEGGEPLPDAEIALLRQWIAAGAKDDTPQFTAADVAFFEREIRPLLAERCFKCHAGDEPEQGLRLTSRHGILLGGTRGPAVVPGKPAESLLIQAIRHAGDLRMPRGGDRLGDAQVAAFEKWIAKGLPWPADRTVLAREKHFTISQADRDHWAFRPLPQPLPDDWSIDQTLRAHHQRLGLEPAPLAERRQLLRRLTYDLIGFPPTPEESDSFVADTASGAYERVVDRLLASPHFGQRWGRHWLDYTRNGSTGQPTRGPGLDAERYAEWVTRCMNESRPWDWFVRAHIAGDLMPGADGHDYSIDQALAAAVPLNGPRTFENAETDTFVLMDKLDEGVEFLGRSLLGISLECARCHDHKFDPVSQRDYYRLLGVFQSSGFAPVPIATKTRGEASLAIADYRALVSEKARLHGFIRRQGLLLNVGGGGRVKQWQQTRPAILAPMRQRLRELELEVLRAELGDAQAKGEDALAADLKTAIKAREQVLQASRDVEGADFGLPGFKELGYFIRGHKSQIGLIRRATAHRCMDLAEELERQAQYWEEERQRWGERSRFGGFARTDPEVAELARAADRLDKIAEQLAGNLEQPWTAPQPGHLWVRTDGGLRRAEDLGPLDEIAKSAGLQFNSDNANRVFLHPWFIGDARLLERGDVLFPGELVPRGVPEFFADSNSATSEDRFVGDLDATSGRLELAQWLTQPGSVQSALVARTAVNRVWQQLFGEALCRTPKELGRLGERPELPELIDGLAASFVREGWSVKQLIRSVVLSEAYRRDSLAADAALAIDSENRYFARQNLRRLDYEAMAGALSWLANGKRESKPAGGASAELARHFDAPSSYEIVERRVVSVAPTQALFMMNHPQTATGLARQLSQRLGLDETAEISDALPSLCMAILQRPPRDDDRSFVARRRDRVGREQRRDELLEFIALMICSNEAIYVE